MKIKSGIARIIKRDGPGGKVIKETFFDEIRNVKVMSIEYEYNPDGKVKKETEYDGFGNCVEILYSYDARGNSTEIRETEYDNGKESYCHTRRNYYDNKNRIIKEKNIYSQKENIRELFYDDNGNLIKSVLSDTFGLDSFFEFENDASGNTTKKTEYTPEEERCETFYSYNESGQLIAEEECTNKGFHRRNEYFYDSNGFKIKEVVKYFSKANEEAYIVEHDFVNDQDGRVIYLKNKNDDFAEIAYFYNEAGRFVISDLFSEKNGEHHIERYVDFGVYSIIGSFFEYVYDSDGNLVSENIQKIDGT